MINWQLFLASRSLFWISVVLLVIYILIFVFSYIIDPTRLTTMKVKKDKDPSTIKSVSEQYVENLDIKIDMPIKYRFVEYKQNAKAGPEDEVYLGSFHEWNGTYYIDIAVEADTKYLFEKTVIHETRHMIVEYLKDKKIINLEKYTEEIAEKKGYYYNTAFDIGVCLLKKEIKDGKI